MSVLREELANLKHDSLQRDMRLKQERDESADRVKGLQKQVEEVGNERWL